MPRDEDPLSRVLAPPPNETTDDRDARLLAEAEAKRISDAIDEELQQQHKAEKKGARPIKILLLGQSESGKSTTLKNFQLIHSQKAFRTERASWRAVVLLNVVRSIRVILEAIADVQALHNASPSASPMLQSRTLPGSRPSSSPSSPTSPADDVPRLTADHLKLRMRLLPLLQVEEVLIRKLTPPGSIEYEATSLTQITNIPTSLKEKEVVVNSQFAWKGLFNRFTNRENGDAESINWDDPDDPGKIIHACGEDMIHLWADPTVQKVLEYQKIRLQDLPGFFLDCLDRITTPKYIPTDDDILRARLKTLGVSEYRFQVKEAAWAPFFDDMNAILFLAPISCFDQVLAEDPMVNRLEDSVLLWKSIVSNPLLSRTSLVLFLNKTDILKAKLAAGIHFGHYIVSYGNRPNDYESTSSYLKKKFNQIHKEHSPETRPFYCHFTTVTDTKATSLILADVQDTIVRRQLQDSKLVA
ncbi:hypothetical protein EW026_g6679 [Hermanssonia centrifuga]|uniref:Guanine nucleotide-binding protein alpha-4 subunit n=1 Tax=Hermanssonia centrifuga TaxID=98765 RepID=A0A4S4KAA1_9APHY|nr:hypothetical protein EW026_g6679 [Hermanssonia centrifuga]